MHLATTSAELVTLSALNAHLCAQIKATTADYQEAEEKL